MSVMKSLAMKVLALLVAIAIWMGVSASRREQTRERAFDIPLALVGIPRDIIVTNSVQESINARLRGRLSALRSLSSQNLEVTIDLSDARPGIMKVAIRPQAFNIPAGVEVMSVNPAKLTFRLEARRQKLVPIRPYLVGDLPQGYRFDPADIVVTPANALVSGPASVIKEFSEVYTDRIILTGRDSSFRQSVGLVSDVPLIHVIDPLSAQVYVPVITPAPPPESPDTSTGAQPASATNDSKEKKK